MDAEQVDEEGSEFEFSDDDAEAIFQRRAAREASTSQPHAALQHSAAAQGSGHRYPTLHSLDLLAE